MTFIDLFNDHAARIARITRWWAHGWISDKERVRYQVYETKHTEHLYAQLVTQEGQALLHPLQNYLQEVL